MVTEEIIFAMGVPSPVTIRLGIAKIELTEDPRHPSYITYTNRMILGTLYYKGIAGIDSMQEMIEQFNHEMISKNLSVFIGEKAGEYVPHHVTENEYLEKQDPMELEEIKQDLVYHLIMS